MRNTLVLAVVAALSVGAMAEKPRFDPSDMFGIELDSFLPFDQDSHANDTNYVSAFVSGKNDRVWLRRFHGFYPYEVHVGADGGVDSVVAIRDGDIAQTNLPALFKAMDRCFAGFANIAPSGGSATNRVWKGVSADGTTYAINAYKRYGWPNGMVTVWMTLQSDYERDGAKRREARLKQQRDAKIAAAVKMMEDKSYQGVWGCSDQQFFLLVCFMKGGLGMIQYQYWNCPFYWKADKQGNVEGVAAVEGGHISKMKAKFDPVGNEFDVRLEFPEDDDFLEDLAKREGDVNGDDPDEVAKAVENIRSRGMVDCKVPIITGKDKEYKILEFIELMFGTKNVPVPLTQTVAKKITAEPLVPTNKPVRAATLRSFKDMPDFAKPLGKSVWLLNGDGVGRLRFSQGANGGVDLYVTIGEAFKSDANAPSYAWLDFAKPKTRMACEFRSRIPRGLSDAQVENIMKSAEVLGCTVEEEVLELNKFWHYRREDILHIRFPADKVGKMSAYMATALGGFLKFPLKLEVYE